VLAYASTPSFDPNQLATGSLGSDDIDPKRAIDRVAHRLLPPGSTFKTIVAAAALERGATSETRYDDAASYTPVGGIAINNATPGPCADGVSIEFLNAMVVSCNVVFAALAVELGADAIVSTAERVGFNAPVPWELGGEVGVIPLAESLASDIPALAQSGIGERDVRATPFLMAMIAAAVANDGVLMAPYVVDARVAPNDDVISSTSPSVLRRLFPGETAAELRDMMREVVVRGTGTAASVGGLEVAGKTGTAEGGGGPHAWFIGFAPFDSPRIAIAVVVEGGGSGGRVAAPIASNVLAAWLSSVGN
jgi:peptidoglycan glycosyltransferase